MSEYPYVCNEYVCLTRKCRHYDDGFCALATPREPVIIVGGKCERYEPKGEENDAQG